MKKNALATSSADIRKYLPVSLAGIIVGIGLAVLSPIGTANADMDGNVFQNERGTSLDIGIGAVVLDALQIGHPGCHKRLTNEYPIGRALVSKRGILMDRYGIELKKSANEAYLCAKGISNLILSIKNDSMGVMGAGDVRYALADLFRSRLGREIKKEAANLTEFFDPHVSQDAAYQEPYYVVTGRIDNVGFREPSESNYFTQGLKQGQDTMQFAYYAVDRVTNWKASFKEYSCLYDFGVFTVLKGGRKYFSLSDDIIGGYKISITEKGSLSFDVVK